MNVGVLFDHRGYAEIETSTEYRLGWSMRWVIHLRASEPSFGSEKESAPSSGIYPDDCGHVAIALGRQNTYMI